MNKYIKNLIVEQNQQNKILVALNIFFNKLLELDIVENTITADLQHQLQGIDRLITLSDGYVVSVDDKNQLSVQLLQEPVGKQSNSIYLEYRREYSTGRESRGIFSKNNNFICIMTGDNYAVIFDMELLKPTFEEFSEELIAKYGYDNNNIAYTEHQEVQSRGDFDSYSFTGYYLRLSFQDLFNELLLAHTFAIIDIDNQKVIL